MSLFDELKRRKVFKVGAAYLVVAWLVVQMASIGFPTFDAPPWALRIFILVVFLGFPIALVFAWAFDFTPEGLKSEGGTPMQQPSHMFSMMSTSFASIWASGNAMYPVIFTCLPLSMFTRCGTCVRPRRGW